MTKTKKATAKKVGPKCTSGMLCRDNDKRSRIAFCPNVAKKDVRLGTWGMWFGQPRKGSWKSWALKDWKVKYSLTPPPKGKAFECDIEL